MKRITVLTMIVAVLATACSGGDDPAIKGNGNARPSGPVEVPQDLPTTEGPGGIAVPQVSPDIPGQQGGATTVDADVIEATTEPLGTRSPRPLLLLMRSPDEANLVFEKLPAGARPLVLQHEDWLNRSLILFTGGAQPDPSYRVLLRDVGVINGGTTMQVFGRFRDRKGSAAEVISEPWVLLSVRSGNVVKVAECLLVYPQTAALQGNCH